MCHATGCSPALSQDGAYGGSSLGTEKRVTDPREGVPCHGGPATAAAGGKRDLAFTLLSAIQSYSDFIKKLGEKDIAKK